MEERDIIEFSFFGKITLVPSGDRNVMDSLAFKILVKKAAAGIR